jgi:hypothetical protein
MRSTLNSVNTLAASAELRPITFGSSSISLTAGALVTTLGTSVLSEACALSDTWYATKLFSISATQGS